MIAFYPQKYLSHLLLLVMVGVSLLGFTIPGFQLLFGYSADFSFLNLPAILSQIALFQFLHADLLHLMLNGLFIYQAGPEVEARLSRKRFIEFFIGSTVFIAFSLSIFSSGITIGMSGFCMALLSYLWIDLSTAKHPMANQILIMLTLNILLGLSGNISFTAHAAGALFGLVWWNFVKRK